MRKLIFVFACLFSVSVFGQNLNFEEILNILDSDKKNFEQIMYLKGNNYVEASDYYFYAPRFPDTTYINKVTNSILMDQAGTKTYSSWAEIGPHQNEAPDKLDEYYSIHFEDVCTFANAYNHETKHAQTFYVFKLFTIKNNCFVDKLERIEFEKTSLRIQFNNKEDFTKLFQSIKYDLTYISTENLSSGVSNQIWEYGNYEIEIEITESSSHSNFYITNKKVSNYIKY